MNKVCPLAFYLPQFHPIPENDMWWGKGFTEWTNVTKAKPLFRGHNQPRFPADLGYYDLRVAEVREMQAEIARAHGIGGFVYYHYWFGNGKQLLERPFNEVLKEGKPDFPFCLCWANQTWSGIWHGAPKKILIKQEYPGKKDSEEHFKYLFSAFEDSRYICIEGKPLFIVYDVKDLPNPKQFSSEIKEAAIKAGFKGIYLMAANLVSDHWDMVGNGFDGKISAAYNRALHDQMFYSSLSAKIITNIKVRLGFEKFNKLKRVDHRKLVGNTVYVAGNADTYPIVVPNWDNTPRSGRRGLVLQHSSPDLFERQLIEAKNFLQRQVLPEHLIFIKSWNEWAEGNYLEPDTIDGYSYLQVLRKACSIN